MIQADPVYSLKNAYISIKAEATLENMFTNVELFGSLFFSYSSSWYVIIKAINTSGFLFHFLDFLG